MMQENDQHQTVSFGQFPVNKLRTSTIKRRSIDFILEKFRFLENNFNWTERLKPKPGLIAVETKMVGFCSVCCFKICCEQIEAVAGMQG
jgi:hypothetical protein